MTINTMIIVLVDINNNNNFKKIPTEIEAIFVEA